MATQLEIETQLRNELDAEFSKGRKVSSWGEVPVFAAASLAHAQQLIDATEIYEYDDVYYKTFAEAVSPEADEFAAAFTLHYDDEVFRVKAADRMFLVNTEGYEYARYVIEIVG